MEIVLYPLSAIVIFIAGLFTKNYLPSYMNQKGKNLADKEDIAAITRQIEEVKTEFAVDNERLKINLQQLLQIHISHRNEERIAIIQFYAQHSTWLYSILEINPGDYDRRNIEELKKKRQFIENFYSSTGVAIAKLDLLVKDKQVVDAANELWKGMLSFKHWVSVYLLELQFLNQDHASLRDRFSELVQESDPNRHAMHAMGDKDNILTEQHKAKVFGYHDLRQIEYRKTLNLNYTFTELAKAYLTTSTSS